MSSFNKNIILIRNNIKNKPKPNNKPKIVITSKNNISLKNNLFYILIRCSNYPKYLENCITLIKSQNYDNYKVICYYSNNKCLEYLKKYNNISYFNINTEKHLLMNNIINGWILFLDEYDILTNNQILYTLNKNIRNIKDALLLKIYYENTDNLLNRDIKLTCFNSIYKNNDMFFINSILKDNTINKIKIDDILLRSTNIELINKTSYLLEEYIRDNKIKQICISDTYIHLKEIFLKKFNIEYYNNIDNNCIFLGINTDTDIINVKHHNGIKHILFIEINEIINCKKIEESNYLAITNQIQTELLKKGLYGTLIDFNLTNLQKLYINELSLENKTYKIGVVITTNGYWGSNVKQCIECYLRHLKNYFIILYINESSDPITLSLKDTFPQITVIYISNQTENGGLTATWNSGIDLCLKENCKSIILSNDDILFDNTIQCIINESLQCNKNNFYCFGPCTNNPGPAKKNHIQYNIRPSNKNSIILNRRGLNYDLNGFFMVFPSNTLIKNKFNKSYYFDPKYPFGGNENEWFIRFLKKGGIAKIVSQTFIYHYKFARWRGNQLFNNTCLYTINTGNYEGNNIHLKPKLPIDYIYFTDNFDLIYRCIENNIIPFYVESNNPKLIQRTIKTSPHIYLPNIYDVSIYIDGNMIPIFNESILNNFKNYKNDIICFHHPLRNKIIQESSVVIKSKLETKENVLKILKKQINDKFKDNIGLTETNVLIRKHKNIKDFSNEWTECIKLCKRDQISYDYLLFKHKVNYLRLSDSFKKNIIKKIAHKNPINRTIQT